MIMGVVDIGERGESNQVEKATSKSTWLSLHPVNQIQPRKQIGISKMLRCHVDAPRYLSVLSNFQRGKIKNKKSPTAERGRLYLC